jgi:DNA polymerase-3 subunit gamma/tau
MSYEVLARKYRPQQFDQVVGQDHVTRTLVNAIETDRVAHAYLLVGPRGTGKTSTARILAKALNCARGPSARPCDACDPCREIAAGNNLDVLEIDGASNNGVEQVRDLRDNVKYAPARGPYKIYVIDEVHMLSVAAFNALLKTLEEPPRHVKFIFATTEPQKVPATILSRCQRFDLRRISARDVVRHLGTIAKAEQVELDEPALWAIARGCDGGLRDAESALDQLIAFRGKTIREEDVLSVFGLVSGRRLLDLCRMVVKGDVLAALRTVTELEGHGKDLHRVVIEMLDYFRNLLIVMYAGDRVGELDLPDADVASLREEAAGTDPGRILRVVDILSEAEGKMRFALSKRTLLEIALIRSGRAATAVSVDSLLEKINQLKQQLGGPPGPAAPAAPSAPLAAPAAAKPMARPAPIPPARPQMSAAEPDAGPSAGAPAAGPGDAVGRLAGQWREQVDRVGHMAPMARGYLMDAKPVRVEAGVVTIGFDPEFAANKSKIDYPRNRKAIEHTIGSLLGQEIKVEFLVLDARSTLPGDIKVDASSPAPASAPPPPPRASRSIVTAEVKQEWIKNPVVQKALELFNGDIVDIRE